MRRLAFVLPLLLAAPLAAQNPQRPRCNLPEHRQFDFWVGRWTVEHPTTGSQQGTSEVTRELGDCVLHEHWAGAAGGHGESFNMYDRTRQVWHQTWVDDSGSIVVLEGRFADGRMVLQGDGAPQADGRRTINRITWTPLEGGRVRQHWETSNDGGATWQTSFDGIYRPRA